MNYIVKPIPFYYNTNKTIIEDLLKEYPFLSVDLVGSSTVGRGIFSLSLGNKENAVLYVGGVHGSEWLTSLVLLLFAERVCECIKYGKLLCGIDIKKALSELGITVIPCINPDGVEISLAGPETAKGLRKFVSSLGCNNYSKWKANAMGTDINHNFSAGWHELRKMENENGITGPSMAQFGGEYPESEAETKIITRLCRIKNFRQCMAVHSQGEELYWQYGENTPKASNIMAKILADSCSYKLVENSGLASHGGLKDWFINEFSKPAFTLEIGKGENPLPVEELYNIYFRIEEALTLFALM